MDVHDKGETASKSQLAMASFDTPVGNRSLAAMLRTLTMATGSGRESYGKPRTRGPTASAAWRGAIT